MTALITGVGGFFLLSEDPDRLAAWYRETFGMQLEEYGGGHFAIFEVRDAADPTIVRRPVFAIKPTKEAPGTAKSAVVPLAVADLDAVKAHLEAHGHDVPDIHLVPGIVRITWIRDADGNQIELAEELFD